jgi:hypothetical protein
MSAPSLYDLLPAIYRLRDADRGLPLQALLAVVQEQADILDDDIAQLYDNWFIETCDDWVVPYIGDLIGYRPVPSAGPAGDVVTAEGRALNRLLVPRREIANTIRYRRRKGTLSLLEHLAADVAGWPARAVEFFRLLSVDQSINHLHLDRGRTADLRDGDALDRLGGAFDEIAHSVDVRRISSALRPGRFNIGNVGVFVWRLRSYSITGAPAFAQEGIGTNFFSFSMLGNDAPLFVRPRQTPEEACVQDELDVPGRIRRRVLQRRASDLVGEDASFQIMVGDGRVPVAPENVVAANLTDWKYLPQRGQVAVDPVLGRIVFHPQESPDSVAVDYHYGFSTEMGGGEYQRPVLQPPDATIYRVGPGETYTTIADALTARMQDEARDAVVIITDSGDYAEPVNVDLGQDETLQIRARVGVRPVLRLLDRRAGAPDSFQVTGAEGSRFTIDGLVITGRAVQVSGDIAAVNIRHSTLVPGWGLDCDCEPDRPNEPSLILVETNACVEIEHSIIGSIQVNLGEVSSDPVHIRVADSILDATSRERTAVAGPLDWPLAHATLTIVRTTVFGGIQANSIELAENSIFEGAIFVARRQLGCMRFCSVVPDYPLRTPRRYHCQPDLVEQAVRDRLPPGNDRDRNIEEERERVRPEFVSVRYGFPTYAQLAQSCADEIVRGADDESELGAFHDLFQPQRAANLQARLSEYSPAGADAGLVYVT